MVSIADNLDKNNLTLGFKNQNGNYVIVKKITEDEFNIGWKAVCELTKVFQEQSMYKMVLENFKEFEKSILFAHKKLKKEIDLIERRMIQANVNRCIINYISLTFVYINRLEIIIKNKYGRESLEFKEFKDVCSLEYDTHFEYRFMNELRNFSQHWGMPVSVIGLTKKEDLILTISTKYLLESSFNWKTRIKKEIEEQSEYLDVIPIITQMNKSLTKIDKAFINASFDNILLNLAEAEKFMFDVDNKNPIVSDHNINNGKIILSKNLILEIKHIITILNS